MKFDYEAFDKWENENHISEQVKRIVNALLKFRGNNGRGTRYDIIADGCVVYHDIS